MENENIFCIYKIINIINGKIYVGQTTQSLEERVRKHFSDSKNKIDNNILNFIINCQLPKISAGRFFDRQW